MAVLGYTHCVHVFRSSSCILYKCHSTFVSQNCLRTPFIIFLIALANIFFLLPHTPVTGRTGFRSIIVFPGFFILFLYFNVVVTSTNKTYVFALQHSYCTIKNAIFRNIFSPLSRPPTPLFGPGEETVLHPVGFVIFASFLL